MEATDVTTVATTESAEATSTEVDSTSVIARAEAALVAPPSEEELMAKKDAVFAYERNHKIVPQVESKRQSRRPLCAGCAFGIRGETEPKYLDGLPFHPNCLKAYTDHGFAMKLSPRYLAAAVPVMTVVARARYEEVYRANEAPADSAEDAEALEDETTDLVQEAVKKGRRSKSA